MTEIRWEPAEDGGFTGYAGTLEAFRIAPSGEGEKWTWTLTSAIPGQLDDRGYAIVTDRLKALAGEWLEASESARPYVAAALTALREEVERYRDAHRTRAADLEGEGKDTKMARALASELDWVLALMDQMEASQ